jgi:hypothetical protein
MLEKLIVFVKVPIRWLPIAHTRKQIYDEVDAEDDEYETVKTNTMKKKTMPMSTMRS